MKTIFNVDAKHHVVLLSFISNIIEGIAFAQLLQIPYLDIFSGIGTSLFFEGSKLSEVALFLFVYRLGRLVISITDSKLPVYFHKNGLMMAMSAIGCGLVLISFSLANSINLIVGSAFLFGVGTTLSGLNLREILTTDTDLRKKRMFNIMSNVGWSIGVGLSGFILNKAFFRSELIIGGVLFISVFFIALTGPLPNEETVENRTAGVSTVDEFKKLHFANKDLLLLFSIPALMTGLITNQINSSIMNQVTGTFKISEGYQSLILLLPILGSLLSFVPSINSFFKRSFTFFSIGVLNFLYFLILVFLFLSTNIYLYCGLLALVGLFSNEALTALYQAVALKQEARLRRATHSLIESVTVIGAMITWLINKVQVTGAFVNFMVILVVPALLLLFLSDFKLIFTESSSCD